MVDQVHANTTAPSSKNCSLETVIYTQRPFKDESVLRTLYLDKMRSITAIAEELASSRQSIKKYLLLFGIPLRPEDSRRMYRKRFGIRPLRNQAAQMSKAGMETLRFMQSLRAQGLSYGRIAKVLNEMGKKTKTGKGKWYANTVFKILRAHENKL